MAKTYEELLEQAAIIRDETAAGKNTATRVGGTITDAVDYVKKLQDTYAGIHAEAAEAKTEAAAAKTKNEEQDGKISSLEAKDATHDTQIAKLKERVIQYLYPKIYQLNEGAGAIVFHGFTEATGEGGILLTKDTYRYRVLYSTTQKQFVLNVTDEASGDGVRVGIFTLWPKIERSVGNIASSESYAQRDCIYYIYVEGEGCTYYYIDSNGNATEQSATYLLRRLVDKNASEIAAAQTKNADQDGEIEDLGAKIRELGATIHDNGNLYEGTAGASSVPVVLAKTFGGTVTATLGQATSARAGVMTIDHVNRISKLEERVLQYLYQKIYQLNEGAGASKFDGFYEGSASVSPDRKEAATEGYTYKVVFKSGSFYLQEIDQDGETVFLYSSWNKIDISTDKHIASSEIYALRDCLYYIFVDGEGSTYYYIDSNGVASEKSATYLLRRLVNKNDAAIAANTKEIARVNSTATQAQEDAGRAQEAADTAKQTATAAQTKNTEQDARLDAIENIVSPLSTTGRYWNEANGTPTAAGHYGSLDALRSLPEMLGLGRYLVKDDRTRRKLDPKDSTKYADDGTDAKLDGTDGQCMWCWNGFYANVWKEGDNLFKVVSFDRPVGNDISIWIPAGGISWLGAGVIDRGDAPFTDKTKWKLCSVINNSEQFRGGGGTALDASKYSKAPADTTPQITMLGMPAASISMNDFGTYARKHGEGWEANWFVARFVVEFLFEVIMGTENSQEAFNANKDADGLYQGGFGKGVTEMPEWDNYNGSYPVIPTSVGLEAGDGVCLVPYNLPNTGGAEGAYHTFNVPVFFGLVGAGYGNLWQFVNGIIVDAGEEKSLVYVAPSMYASYNPSIVTDKIMVAECPRVIGFINRKSYQGLCCMPTEVGGSATIRFADYFYTNVGTSKGLRVRAAGGFANQDKASGASCTYVPYEAAIAFKPSSAPLCYFTEDPIIPDSQSIANNN